MGGGVGAAKRGELSARRGGGQGPSELAWRLPERLSNISALLATGCSWAARKPRRFLQRGCDQPEVARSLPGAVRGCVAPSVLARPALRGLLVLGVLLIVQ